MWKPWTVYQLTKSGRQHLMITESGPTEHVRCAVKEIREAENVNFVHAKNISHLHAIVSQALPCDSSSDNWEAVIKYDALLQYANRLFQQYCQICLSHGLLCKEIKKPSVVVPVHWLSFYRALVSATEMWDSLTELTEQETSAKTMDNRDILGCKRALLYAKTMCLQETSMPFYCWNKTWKWQNTTFEVLWLAACRTKSCNG